MKRLIIFVIQFICINSTVISQNFWYPTPCSGAAPEYSLIVSNNGTILCAADTRIYRSTNNGDSWSQVGSQWVDDIYVLALNKNNNYLFAGMYGNGVRRSTDDGLSWSNPSLTGVTIWNMCVAPNGTIFAAYTNSSSSTHGIYKSTDNGSNWSICFSAPYSVAGLAVDKQGNLYCGTSDYYGTVSGQIFKSSNNGVNWTLIANYTEWRKIRGIAVDANLVLYCFQTSGIGNGAFRSTNGGSTWSNLGVSLECGNEIYPTVVNDANEVYIGSISGGVYRIQTATSPMNPENSGISSTSVYSLALAPNQYIFAGCYNTLNRTTNSTAPAPAVPGIPSGPTSLCQNPTNSNYTINNVPNATSYIWQLDPLSAGTIAGTGTTGTVDWNNTFSGLASVSVKSCNQAGCSNPSNALAVNIIVAPTITGTTPGSRCGSGTVVLGATANAGIINWYPAASGGNSLGIGTSFTTPSLTSSTTYYTDATEGTCVTPERTPVVATVNPPPSITATTPGSKCGPGSVVLGAIANTGTINWYATATGGSSLWAGTSFTTPSITSTTTYYVDAQQGTCVTLSRTAVIATIITPPSITNTTPGSRCGPGSVVLGATSNSGTINWYAVPTGGTLLGNGGNYSTPSISLTTTYYTDATLNSCTTATRTSVVATINTQPAITVQPVSPAAICAGNGTANFSVTATGTQISYQWQESNDGGLSFTNITGCTGIYSGCTTNSLTITNPISGMNGYKYRCVISGLCSPAAITNGNVMLSVNACQVAPITYAGKVCGAIGNTIIIPVTVLNFSGIAGISLTLHYNAQVLSWISAQNINPSLPAFDINIGAGGPGEIVLSWFGNATTLTNGSSLCELKFTYLGGITDLTWYDNGNSCEYADELGNALLDTPYESYYKSGHVEQSPCANTAVENTVVGNGVIRCFDATQTITVAGNGTIFTVYSGGQATMIAGQKISYLPGTTVYNGGYLWGYIAPLGPFCASSNMPTFPSTTGIIKSNEENLTNSKKQLFTIYPNPTNGNFILELSEEIPTDKMIVDIYGMWGKKVLSEVLQGEKKYEFSLSGSPTGVYFIRVISEDKSETIKIIKE